jgi:hypothetical protein
MTQCYARTEPGRELKSEEMRTGADYRQSLLDGRNLWVTGEGPVEDVTNHPATSGMVDEYVAWYDRHFDPNWQNILLTAPDADGARRPLAFEPPKTSADLQALGKSLRSVLFLSGGNITHTPGYGALIALGLVNYLKGLGNSTEDIEAAEAYRDSIASSGRFLTFAGGGSLIGSRLRADPAERVALRLVSETPKGIVVSGKALAPQHRLVGQSRTDSGAGFGVNRSHGVKGKSRNNRAIGRLVRRHSDKSLLLDGGRVGAGDDIGRLRSARTTPPCVCCH